MYIKTTDNLPGDIFNEDGTVTLPYIHFHIQDDIYFVEDDADLTGITHTVDDGNYQDVLNEKCKEEISKKGIPYMIYFDVDADNYRCATGKYEVL